ncbi:oligoendopeptidase F [Ameyamaea chiangmaiensis NBRC 103196]|uniref:M3 family oligoendopeptidase n=1 Tax=Ameyamaea chiangmaiensis TaxID=442969 RepID=A0A850P6X1_9PROT|nr:M3 family oligoendopeptidase [Ameyamaea chiangmaiensis]MBS4073897.1 M3 family oligoendopeptidase [Ameyamaea chiangmaiensis]NVN40357.1 M3 family oligoendopeptidase [Ameyamaea chiangmaiensis]GBQ68017.1 oligoendopeptidase F [Ameyamaea chiangmaiensis NBRC 103196]
MNDARNTVWREARQAETGAPDAALPRWDLSDLYDSPRSAVLARDLDTAEADARAFAAAHKGKVATLTATALADAIAAYEHLDEILGRAGSYASLLFSADSVSPEIGQFSQMINERLTAISAHLLFFTLELNRLGDDDLARKASDPALARWAPFLRDVRVFRPHQLSDDVEHVLHEKSVTGRAAWNRLFDETMASLRVTMSGRQVMMGEALNSLSDADRATRAEAARGISATLGDNIRLFSLVTNTLAKDKAISDQLRAYPRPTSQRNLGNMVEDEVVDALVSAVVADYPRLSHRYYTMKARWLGLDTLEHWDRNAPLPGDDDARIAWDEAKARVQAAYSGFDPRLGDIARDFLTKPWIDAAPVPGKSSGAFAHPTVPSAHPYILMNYHGRTRDVMTLAHEMGHGIHQVLASRQGYFQSATPLTLAETASVFGEMLTFQSLLDAQTDPKRRRLMLAAKVEDMLNTVVRQIAFYRFETLLHDERRKGELLPEQIGALWRKVQTESLGPAFSFTPDYDLYWSYVPHFVHSPFYVYAYAFGDCLVNALYGVYRDGLDGFADKYVAMLEAGGTLRHKDLLAPFGLDASDPGFWRRGLDVIAGFIDELEQGETA